MIIKICNLEELADAIAESSQQVVGPLVRCGKLSEESQAFLFNEFYVFEGENIVSVKRFALSDPETEILDSIIYSNTLDCCEPCGSGLGGLGLGLLDELLK